MKLPWKLKDELEQKEEKIDRLEDRIEELQQDRDSWKERFEAEKERRSELSTKKQEAEEERNRLKKKLDSREKTEEEKEEVAEENGTEAVDFEEAKTILRKLGSIESDQEDMVTVYCPGNVGELADLKSLKNSVDRETYSVLQKFESFAAFVDPDLGTYILKMAPFFDEKVEIDGSFRVERLLEFLESEKHWCVVSAGDTKVYSEEDGKVSELERVKSRIDREHSKGGFSQGRFERKREEQIETHIEKVRESLQDYPEAYVIGDKRFCEDLPGTYLGGFDGNRERPEQFYRFSFTAVF